MDAQLSRAGLGNVLLKNKRFSVDGQSYYSELYNHESCGDNEVLDCSQPPEEDLQPILHEEVEIGSSVTDKGEVAIVDNIPAKLVQAGGEIIIDVLTEICYRIWRMAYAVDSVTDYYTP